MSNFEEDNEKIKRLDSHSLTSFETCDIKREHATFIQNVLDELGSCLAIVENTYKRINVWTTD